MAERPRTNAWAGSCEDVSCGAWFPSRNELILHYAEDHDWDRESIAEAMGYALQSVGPKLVQARKARKNRSKP